jgi:hypothetical protein
MSADLWEQDTARPRNIYIYVYMVYLRMHTQAASPASISPSPTEPTSQPAEPSSLLCRSLDHEHSTQAATAAPCLRSLHARCLRAAVRAWPHSTLLRLPWPREANPSPLHGHCTHSRETPPAGSAASRGAQEQKDPRCRLTPSLERRQRRLPSHSPYRLPRPFPSAPL